MKITNKGYAVIAGLLLFVSAAYIWKSFPDADSIHYIILSKIVLIGLALTVILMAILAIIYSVMGVEDPKQALGLPEGSVRALLAFSLVLIFVCQAAYLFNEINKNNQPIEGKPLSRVTKPNLLISKPILLLLPNLRKTKRVSRYTNK